MLVTDPAAAYQNVEFVVIGEWGELSFILSGRSGKAWGDFGKFG